MTDDLDRRIVDALVEDGRRPFVKIAQDLHFSEATIRQRVAKLTAEGVMQITAHAPSSLRVVHPMVLLDRSLHP